LTKIAQSALQDSFQNLLLNEKTYCLTCWETIVKKANDSIKLREFLLQALVRPLTRACNQSVHSAICDHSPGFNQTVNNQRKKVLQKVWHKLFLQQGL